MRTNELSHFYWVAKAQNKPDEPAWHVGVVDVAETMDDVVKLGGKATSDERVLSVAQAKAVGIDLKKIAAAINADAIAQVHATKAAHAADLEAAKAIHSELQTTLDAAGGQLVKHQAEIENHKGQIERMQADLDEKNALIEKFRETGQAARMRRDRHAEREALKAAADEAVARMRNS